jgi:hypothetical protein
MDKKILKTEIQDKDGTQKEYIGTVDSSIIIRTPHLRFIAIKESI